MSNIKIPVHFEPGFHSLVTISEQQIKTLGECLKSMEVGTGPRNLEREIESKLPDLENAYSLANTIYSFGSLLGIESDREKLANDFVQSFAEKKQLQDEERKALFNNLIVVLSNSDYLIDTYKAINLMTDNDKVFRDCKVLTDVRMLFKEKIQFNDNQSVIIHSLKIEYQEGDDYKTFFAGLDSTDLSKLKKQINRAEKKEEAIKKHLSSLKFISITD
ncbi:MAG: hypothetical protein WD267_04055 [Balneolales bacterium]